MSVHCYEQNVHVHVHIIHTIQVDLKLKNESYTFTCNVKTNLTEILLKVALNTITLTLKQTCSTCTFCTVY